MSDQVELQPPGSDGSPSGSGGPEVGGPPPNLTLPVRRRRSHTVAVVLTAVLLVAGAGALVSHAVWSVSHATSGTPGASLFPDVTGPGFRYPSSGSTATGAPSDTPALAAVTNPALVDITATLPYQAAESLGTGLVLAVNGEIVTNNHVIDGSGTITVRDVGNGKSYSAVVVGYSRTDDIAVLRLSKASGLKTISVGNSSKVAVGDGVVAVGNAGGAGGTPSYTGGSITATDQAITAADQADGTTENLTGLLETNAQIVAGDSGGALVASNRKIIGMLTAGSTGFRFQTGYGYAIPINQVLSAAREIESGRASASVHIGATAFLGVEVQTPASGAAGAQIVQVISAGPAAKAGFSQGDTITALGGQPIGSPADLSNFMASQKPGTAVTVQYLDSSGGRHTTTVHLTSGPPQ